jgi:two-component system, NarL family, sensor histidine kinase UhpB
MQRVRLGCVAYTRRLPFRTSIAMGFSLTQLLKRGPEKIDEDRVSIRERPIEELGLTALYILIAGVWVIFADDVRDLLMGVKMESPAMQTLKGINFVTTTGLVLYLILRRSQRRRRQAQEASRLSQERFESVALAATDAIWDLNLETKVVWWSEGVQKLFGYRPEDVSSNFDWWLQRVHPDDRDRVAEAIRKVADSGGRAWAGEYRFRRKDDTYAVVLDRGFIIHDVAGKPVRLVGGMSDISERRHAQTAVENSRQQLRALTARLQTGREEERAAVAREIHDDLGQILTAIKLDLDWLERKIGERQDDPTLSPVLERVLESGEMIESAIQSVQRIATDLRPALLDNIGLGEAIRDEAVRFEQRSGITCELQLPPSSPSLPPESSTAIFRVLQEALTNVIRHAQAKAVRITLEIRDSQVVLQLEDDGKGIHSDAIGDPRSLGLLGMSERASALGGNVAVAPVEPHGTRVTLQLPLPATTVKAEAKL